MLSSEKDKLAKLLKVDTSLLSQLFSFGLIGGGLLGLYMLLYLNLDFLGDQFSNLTALGVTTLLGMFLNRRFTFKSFDNGTKDYIGSGLVFLLTLALTSSMLLVAPNLSLVANWPEVLLVSSANLSVSALRFFLLRNWVFGRHKSQPVHF